MRGRPPRGRRSRYKNSCLRKEEEARARLSPANAYNLDVNVSIAEAKNKLTRLIQDVEKGERVTICRHGTPVVDLVRTAAVERKPRRFGTLRDKIKMLDPDWAKPQNDDGPDTLKASTEFATKWVSGRKVRLDRGGRAQHEE